MRGIDSLSREPGVQDVHLFRRSKIFPGKRFCQHGARRQKPPRTTATTMNPPVLRIILTNVVSIGGSVTVGAARSTSLPFRTSPLPQRIAGKPWKLA